MNRKMTFTASGDALIMNRLPDNYVGREKIRDFIRRGEARITNLETTLTNGDCYPSTFSGGTWLTAPECVLEDLEDFGFNLYSIANNHMLDYSYGGLQKTLDALRRRKLCFAGAGDNLLQASCPVIADLPSGRVGFIAMTSTFDDTARAGVQGPYLPGRPGINSLRHKVTHLVTKEHLEQLKIIAENTGINIKNKRRLKTGYKLQPSDNTFEFRDILFKEHDTEGKLTTPDAEDVERTVRDIKNMKHLVEHVVVMIHSHEMKSDNMEDVDDFIVQSAHEFIDAGASFILGGGTHQLKGIELYHGKPIFYSLGNFIYQNEFVRLLPPEFMSKYNLPYDTEPLEALAVRRSHAKNGGLQSRENYLSVIPYIEMEGDTCTRIELLPISLGADQKRGFKAIPYPANNEETAEIFQVLKRLCSEFGTEIADENGCFSVKL